MENVEREGNVEGENAEHFSEQSYRIGDVDGERIVAVVSSHALFLSAGKHANSENDALLKNENDNGRHDERCKALSRIAEHYGFAFNGGFGKSLSSESDVVGTASLNL